MNNCKSLKVLDVQLEVGDTLTFQVEPRTLDPRCRYSLVVNMDWGDSTGAEIVFISDGTNTYQVFDCIADRARVAELRKCCCYCNRVELFMVFGADQDNDAFAGHFQIKNGRTANNCIPTFTAVAPAAAAGA